MIGEVHNKFKKSLKLSLGLIQAERKYKDPPTDEKSQNMILGLRGGALILMVASFENFIKDLFNFHLQKLNDCEPPIPFYRLSTKFQKNAIVWSLKRACEGEKYNKSTDGRIIAEAPFVCKKIINGEIITEVFSDVNSNPDGHRISTMFQNVGMDNIFSVIKKEFEKNNNGKPEAKSYIEAKLNEIVGKRHLVAHKADVLNISRADMSEYVKFLTILTLVLERNFHFYIKKIITELK